MTGGGADFPSDSIPLDRTDSTSSSLRIPESVFEAPLGVDETKLALVVKWSFVFTNDLVLILTSSILTLVLL